jgi:hypothetical protein
MKAQKAVRSNGSKHFLIASPAYWPGDGLKTSGGKWTGYRAQS